jgi:hypothetical protein
MDSAFGERGIAMQRMRIEDRTDVAQTVASDGGDVRFGASCQRQSGTTKLTA